MGKILEGILECLNNIGIVCGDKIEPEEKIADYINDSISFITFVVELENYFQIEIAENYLVADEWVTFQNAIEIIQKNIEEALSKEE